MKKDIEREGHAWLRADISNRDGLLYLTAFLWEEVTEEQEQQLLDDVVRLLQEKFPIRRAS